MLCGDQKRQYSLCSDPVDRKTYRIAVLREADGRGVSRWMHDHVGIGTSLVIGAPRNTFPIEERANRHILIAGGIGITPFLAMLSSLRRQRASFHLHYCGRSTETTAFLAEVHEKCGTDGSTLYFDGGEPSQGCDVAQLLASQRPGDHVYCCGPKGLINAVQAATSHWQPGSVHFEHFSGAASLPVEAEAFAVELQSSGRRIEIAAQQTILSALQGEGIPLEASCESGAFGACLIRYIAGQRIHRDVCLSDDERASQIASAFRGRQERFCSTCSSTFELSRIHASSSCSIVGRVAPEL